MTISGYSWELGIGRVHLGGNPWALAIMDFQVSIEKSNLTIKIQTMTCTRGRWREQTDYKSEKARPLGKNPVSLWVAIAPIQPWVFFPRCSGVLWEFPWEMGIFLPWPPLPRKKNVSLCISTVTGLSTLRIRDTVEWGYIYIYLVRGQTSWGEIVADSDAHFSGRREEAPRI